MKEKYRKHYPSDVSDEEWAFVAPYLALVREETHSSACTILREIFDALRWSVRSGAPWDGICQASSRPGKQRSLPADAALAEG